MRTTFTARVAAIAGVGLIAASVALAAPAFASSGKTTLSAGNGTVGVNQVLTATYVSANATTSCDDESGVVSFDFMVGKDTDLGTIGGTCTPVSNGSYAPVATWTATMNWTPTASGNISLNVNALQQLMGGSPTVGSASKRVSIAGAQPTGAPSKPQSLKVTGVSTNAVSLNWNAPSSSGGSAISGYIVKWTGPTSGQLTVQATNANVGTLSAGSTYTFSVSAANAQGWSDWVSVTQNTANAPTPPPIQQQTLTGPMWTGGGPKVKSGQWKSFNNTSNLDTNAGREAQLSAINRSSTLKSVTFRYDGDNAQVRAVLKPGATSGSFTLREFSPALPGFTAMSMTRVIKVVR
ncbi:MAG: fibronectin type III domain-containing protein [Actinomycetales bacterium]|nr:fibronectin type III domain-containing protein [Actinomycetales bacterium]